MDYLLFQKHLLLRSDSLKICKDSLGRFNSA
jgi:hypothetical protein